MELYLAMYLYIVEFFLVVKLDCGTLVGIVVFQPPIFTKLVPHCLKYKVEEPLEVINRDLFALC